ncbi:MAG: HEAT repeat domain-containing protein [Candidatus Latescibacterota bacterium]|nr:HEAT repeat domain-containing protein [Candidatus Latescibacterota bacterium]
MRSLFPQWLRPLAICGLLLALTSGCGLRTMLPIRYLPILGKEKEVKTTDVLIRALHDPDVKVRADAVLLLGLLSQSPDKGTRKEVARVLGVSLKDRDPGLRLQIVETLGTMDPDLANKYLKLALRDTNPFVHHKVLEVLDTRERQRLTPDSNSGNSQTAGATSN